MKHNRRIAVVTGCRACGKTVSIRTTADKRARDTRMAICRECYLAQSRCYRPNPNIRATAPDP